jgi:hypothetical protein
MVSPTHLDELGDRLGHGLSSAQAADLLERLWPQQVGDADRDERRERDHSGGEDRSFSEGGPALRARQDAPA